jgi:hypothetical protein
MTAVTKRILALYCFSFAFSWNVVNAQERFTVSGIIKDKSTGEVLIGAAVKIDELNTGTTTNAYGFYAISVKPGTYTLNVSFQGYQLFSQKTTLSADLRNDIELMPVSTVLNEVVVSSKRKNEHIAKPVWVLKN